MKGVVLLIISFISCIKVFATHKNSHIHHTVSKTTYKETIKTTPKKIIPNNPFADLGKEVMQPLISMDSTLLANTNSLQQLLGVLESTMGKPYRTGSSGPNGFDCSGLMHFAFSFIGVTLPHSSAAISKMGQIISFEELQPGDLLFFAGKKKSKNVGHVGCVCKVDSGKIYMIHSSQEGVNICNVNDNEYFKNRLICAKRVIKFDSCLFDNSKL